MRTQQCFEPRANPAKIAIESVGLKRLGVTLRARYTKTSYDLDIGSGANYRPINTLVDLQYNEYIGFHTILLLGQKPLCRKTNEQTTRRYLPTALELCVNCQIQFSEQATTLSKLKAHCGPFCQSSSQRSHRIFFSLPNSRDSSNGIKTRWFLACKRVY